MTCPRCGSRVFTEQTPDGLEAICIAGHRTSAVAITPLDIPQEPPKRYVSRENGPRIGMMKL